jgi:hypothetical protein
MEENKGNNRKLEKVQFSMQEIWAASKTKVFKNKKKYNRKDSNKGPFYCFN